MAFKARELPKLDPKKLSQQELDEAMKLLASKKDRMARIKSGELKGSTGVSWADMSKEQKERALKYARRRAVRQSLIIAKALKAGITVSDKEVDAAIAAKGK